MCKFANLIFLNVLNIFYWYLGLTLEDNESSRTDSDEGVELRGNCQIALKQLKFF